VEEGITRIVVESIETEAELIRLSLDAGLPWEDSPHRGAQLSNHASPTRRFRTGFSSGSRCFRHA